MKKVFSPVVIVFVQLIGFLLFAEGTATAVEPPEEVTIDQLAELYQPVVFNHLMHGESYDCSRCHHDSVTDGQKGDCSTCHSGRSIGATKKCSACHMAELYEQPKDAVAQQTAQPPSYHIDTPGLKAGWHFLCRNCHLEDGGPADCQDCHAYTEKGREFFKEK